MITGPINALEPTYNRDHLTDPWRQFMAEILASALYDIAGDGRVPKEARGKAREEAEYFFESGEYTKYADALEIERHAVWKSYKWAEAAKQVKAENKGQGHPLTKGEKVIINNMRRVGKNNREIAAYLGRHEDSVSRWVRREHANRA